MKYKALLLDVDGTLIKYDPKSLPSKKVTDAINKASKKIHIGVATGRPLFMLHHFIEHLNLTGPSVINDGAQVIDVITKKVYYEQSILNEDIPKVLAILKDYPATFMIQDNLMDHLLPDDIPEKA